MNPVTLTATVSGTVPVASFICIGISLALLIFIPIALFLYLKPRYPFNLRVLINGALVYMVCSLLLPQAAAVGISFAMNAAPESSRILGIIFSLFSLLLQIAGLLFAGKKILKNGKFGDFLYFGIGYVAFESFMQTATTLFNYLSMGTSINQVGADALLSQMQEATPEQANQAALALQEFIDMPSVDYLSYGINRTLKMVLILCCCVLLYAGFRKIGSSYNIGMAAGFLALYYLPNLLYQVGVYKNPWIAEALFFVVAVLFLFVTYREFTSHMEDEKKKLFGKPPKPASTVKKFPKFNMPKD